MPQLINWKINFLGIFIALFGLLIGVLVFEEASALGDNIRVDKIYIENFNSQDQNAPFLFAKKENKSLSIATEELDTVFISEQNTTKYPFNALGVRGEIINLNDAEIEIYLKVENKEWQKIELIIQEKKAWGYQIYSDVPYAIQGQNFQYKVILKRTNRGTATPELKNLEFFYLDTTQKPALTQNAEIYNSVNVAPNAKKIHNRIITREEWGADETWRFWEPEYTTPQKIVLHHTASGTGEDDPAATLRAIYFWHAQIMGWGDIGYNYIVDTQGNVYEGRYGGEGVIGAHVYNEITRIDYNPGTIGVAVLGCYENEKSGCSTVNEFSPTLKSNLSEFLGYLASKHDIKPQRKSILASTETYNITSHRNLDYTLCPGSQIYQNLASIRRQTKKNYEALEEKYFAGKLTQHNFDDNYTPAEVKEINVIYTNTGNRVWEKNESYLKIYNGSGKRPTKFRHIKWRDSLGKFEFTSDTIEPGQTATFTFKIKAPQELGEYKLKFKFFINKSVIQQSRKTIKVTVRDIN